MTWQNCRPFEAILNVLHRKTLNHLKSFQAGLNHGRLGGLSFTGADGCPLSYIIRDDTEITEDDYDLMEGQMKRIYDAPCRVTTMNEITSKCFKSYEPYLLGA